MIPGTCHRFTPTKWNARQKAVESSVSYVKFIAFGKSCYGISRTEFPCVILLTCYASIVSEVLCVSSLHPNFVKIVRLEDRFKIRHHPFPTASPGYYWDLDCGSWHDRNREKRLYVPGNVRGDLSRSIFTNTLVCVAGHTVCPGRHGAPSFSLSFSIPFSLSRLMYALIFKS